jgi:hypothetical protein
MSVDSPNSQSSGHGGAVIGFTDSFSINTVSPTSFPTPTSNPADAAVNANPGDLTSPGAISPSTPAPAGLFDSPRPGSEGVTSPSQLDTRFATSWDEQSPPLMTSAPSGSLAQYHFEQQSFDNTSFPTSTDQGSGLRSLSAFAFHTNPVSQPVSFMRHSVDGSNNPIDPSIFHAQDEGHLTHESHEDQGIHLAPRPVSEKGGSSHSVQDAGALHALLFDSHKVSIAGSNAASSPRLGETPTTMGSEHHYHNELIHDHQTLSDSMQEGDQESHETSLAQNKWQTYLNSVTDNYGLDSGRPDQDLTFNNDHAAIDINYALDLISARWHNQEASQSATSQPIPKVQAQFCSGYYASPVPINIPRYLSPLPSSLLENPINLMYFHHFLNHTARMLVPHNCDNNPFISVLPSSKSRHLLINRLSKC